MKVRLAVLPGDGIGPEVTEAAVSCLQAVATRYGHLFEYQEMLIGGCAIDATGVPLPTATLQGCLQADAVLLGAVGGPQWEKPSGQTPRLYVRRRARSRDCSGCVKPWESMPTCDPCARIPPWRMSPH